MATGADGGKGGLEVDRFRSRPDGRSEFVRAHIPWAAIVPLEPGRDDVVARLTATFASPNVKFVLLPPGQSQPAHPAPEPQFVIVLGGRIEVETTGDRGVKSWGAGEYFIASDHDGTGHLTRTLGEEPTLLMFVPLGSLDLEAWTPA